jgi:hypothetical protein
MANVEKYDDLIIGSGIAGKFTAWTRDSRLQMVRRVEPVNGKSSGAMKPFEGGQPRIISFRLRDSEQMNQRGESYANLSG